MADAHRRTARRELIIDALKMTATLQVGAAIRRFPEQWFEFYGVLAREQSLSADRGGRVGRDDLARLGSWSRKKLTSVSTEVRRHIATLEEAKLATILDYGAKGTNWRLSISSSEVRWIPSKSEAFAKLEERGWKRQLNVEWLGEAITHLVALNRGQLEEAVHSADRMATVSRNQTERSLAQLCQMRGLVRSDRDTDPIVEAFEEVRAAPAGSLLRSIYYRFEALRIFETRFDNPVGAIWRLSRMLAESEEAGDSSTTGSLLNTLAVIYKRAGDYLRPEDLLIRALPLSMLSGDLYSVSAILFNLAHTYYLRAMENMQSAEGRIYQLLDNEYQLRVGLAIGRDSLQSEILGIETGFRAGNRERMEVFLGRADLQIAASDAGVLDQAGYRRARAKYYWSTISDTRERKRRTLNELAQALTMYEKAGLSPRVLIEEIKNVRNGVAPTAPIDVYVD